MTTAAKLYDLTATNVAREIELQRDGSPLADPTFRRHVDHVTTQDERQSALDRLRKVRAA